MVLQGRQCTGANTTPLGALNPAFTGQARPQEGSLLMPHLANQLQGNVNQQWTPSPQQAAPQAERKEEPGSWEPSRMRKKSKSKSRERGNRRRRSRSRSGSRRRKRRSRSRSRRSRSKGRSRRHRSRSRSRDRSRRKSKTPEKIIPVVPAIVEEPKSEKQKKRRSRWGAQDDLEFIPGMPVTLPPNLTEEQQRLYLIHVKIEEINKKLKSGNLDADDTRYVGLEISRDEGGDTSPSPEPIYNSEGKRLNTREFRIRKRLEDERQALIQEAMRLNPNFRPAGGEVQQTRHQEKVMIPVLQNPNVNFMGLLIGPRGNSLKKLEEETGTKIMIRGKGSVKEGKGRKDGQPMPGEDEDLHALISAPTEEGLHRAIKRITQIINDAIVAPDNTNELKKLQMRELALLNGTLRDEDLLKCSNCGALDHRDWECQGDRNVTQMVSCARCGGGGHLASDCRVDLSQTGNQNTLPDKAKMDSEYMSLMAELGVAEDGVGLGGSAKQSQSQNNFNPQQTNVIGGGVRPKHPGLGSDFAPKSNHNNNNDSNTHRGGFNNRGMGPRGPVRSERPPWQQRGPPPGHDGGRGGFRPYPRFSNRSPHPSGMRGPAPWQQDPYGGGHRPPYQPRNALPSHGASRGHPRGSFGGYMPPPGVNIPASKPPPPPEEPPEQSSDSTNTSSKNWDQSAMPGWGMMPPVMPPWMSAPQIPPIPPAPPSQPPPPSS